MTADDLQRRLIELFAGELDDAVRTLTTGLLHLEENPGADTTSMVADLFRVAHSVKGAAMSAGVDDAVAVARELEEAFAQLRDEHPAQGPEDTQALLEHVDALAEVARRLLNADQSESESPASSTAAPPPPGSTSTTSAPAVSRAVEPPVTRPPAAAPDAAHSLRLATAQVDALVRRVGDLLTTASRVHELSAALSATADEHVAGLPPEVGRILDRLAHRAGDLSRDVTRVGGGAAAAIEDLTLQPFAQACEGLDRAVRDVARAGNRLARLQIDGADVEIDRRVAAMLREPLLHIVRNAVDHGIESPTERESVGKPATGSVRVAARLHNGRVEVTVSDDGRGMDRAALRRAASAADDVPSTVDAQSGDDDLALAFRAGISTAPQLTDVSGRGVGLDVVRARVESAGGTVDIASTPDEGTEVTLTSPISLALMRVLLLRLGDQVVGLPTAVVERLATRRDTSVHTVGSQSVAAIEQAAWPVVGLGSLLGLPTDRPTPYLVLTRIGDVAAALAVDELVDEREVPMRPVPSRLAGLLTLLGVTTLPGGRVVLVLNPATIVPRAGDRTPQPAPIPEPAPRRVLVAEDALTTRVLQHRILEGAGFQVVSAVDGAEAWELIQAEEIDAVVSDVDMPGMDGIELCRAIRRTPGIADLPVVLVTSLGSEDDRRRGVEAGADAYLVKAEFDPDALVQTVRRLL